MPARSKLPFSVPPTLALSSVAPSKPMAEEVRRSGALMVSGARTSRSISGLTKDDCATDRTVAIVPLRLATLRSALSAVSLTSSSRPCGRERLRSDTVVLRCAASAPPLRERSRPLMRA
ncbi:hypothetical protein D3C78_1253230 [compost metagenome]